MKILNVLSLGVGVQSTRLYMMFVKGLLPVNQFIGISLDEAGRARRMLKNVPAPKYLKRLFPLIDLNLTRAACRSMNEAEIPHEVPRSACVFCPYHNDHEWHRQKTEQPADFDRSVLIDHALRDPNAVVNRKLEQTAYLHRSCKPLELVQFDTTPPKPREYSMTLDFTGECEGVCGL